MTEAMPFLQKYDITFLRPLPICPGFFHWKEAALHIREKFQKQSSNSKEFVLLYL